MAQRSSRHRGPKIITRKEIIEVPRKRKTRSRDRRVIELPVEEHYGSHGYADEDSDEEEYEIVKVIEHEGGQSKVTYRKDPERRHDPNYSEVPVLRMNGDFYETVRQPKKSGRSMILMDDDDMSEISDYLPERHEILDRRPREIRGSPRRPRKPIPGPPRMPIFPAGEMGHYGQQAGYPLMLGPTGRPFPPGPPMNGYLPMPMGPPPMPMGPPPMAMGPPMEYHGPHPPPMAMGHPMEYHGPRVQDFPRERRSKDRDCIYWIGDQYYRMNDGRRGDAFPNWAGF